MEADRVAADGAPPAQPFPVRDEVLKAALQSGIGSTKMAPAALNLVSVLVRSFVEEACARSQAEANESADSEVTEEHLEKILPQLLLDMGP